MIPVEFDKKKAYDVYLVNNRPYLFTDIRVKRESIPEHLHVYDVADGDGDGCFARIKPFIFVNYWGTIIGTDELPLIDGAYCPVYGTDEYEGWFTGEYMTLDEYLTTDLSEIGNLTKGEEKKENLLKPGKRYRTVLSVISLIERYDEDSHPVRKPLKPSVEIMDDVMGNMRSHGFLDLHSLEMVIGEDGISAAMVAEFTVPMESAEFSRMELPDMFDAEGCEIYSDDPVVESVDPEKVQ